jgi:hypothetical protein
MEAPMNTTRRCLACGRRFRLNEDFHDLIAERYENAATILTSNLDFSEWRDAFAGNRILGEATLDRLRHGAYRIVLDGESFRPPKPMPEIDKNRLAKSPK